MEVEREIVVPETPDEVWEALTEAERLEEWFATEVELDARPGGDVYAGMAMYDAMQFVKPDVQTYCIGMAMSMGALLLAGGADGKRFVLPNSKVMIHQGSGGFRGTPADIQIAAREILSLTRRYAEVIAHHSGRDVEEVVRDIDRDRFLEPAEAVEYGLADSILSSRNGNGTT
jgi:ATP-dependent Clp protease protease subunit